MENQIVLREFIEIHASKEGSFQFLTESEKKEAQEGSIFLVGKIQCADELNGNGRVYPRHILEREMIKYKNLCQEHRALGELDHPSDSVVNLKNASHKMVDVWWEGNAVMGKLKALNTPSGKILQTLVEDGVKLGISSRGLGSIKEDKGRIIVCEDFQLICYDIVQEPSTKNAFMLAEQKKNQLFSKSLRIKAIMESILELN